MSGCCGQVPVIISGGAAAVPRLDIETVLLCDVLPDGTVAGVALVEPSYDTGSSERVGTRVVDPVTGAAYAPVGTLRPCPAESCPATTSSQVLCDTAGDGTVVQFMRATTYDCEGALLGALDRTLDGADYAPVGTVAVCPAGTDCAQPTTPTATVGLCLADGTPIAVTVVRDCDGVVASEGWLNLSTGAYSAGAPPAGTVACGGSSSVQVSGTFCDVDAAGDVVGLVLIEYSYAADGTIDSVRLVDATTGDTYVPAGTITTCPAGTGQPEQDVVQLCDVAADGTTTPLIRDYRRDELGAISGHTDYLLDGTAYVPTGTVGVCQPEACNTTTVLALCDSAPAGPVDLASRLTFTNDADPLPWTIPGGGVNHQPALVSGQPFWDGGTVTVAPTTAVETPEPLHRVISAHIGVQGAAQLCDPPTDVTLTLDAHILNLGPDAGQATCGRWHLHNGSTIVVSQSALSVSVGGFRNMTITGTVPWAAILAGQVHISLDLETSHLGRKSWEVSEFAVTVTPAELDPCDTATKETTPFLRTVVTDCAGLTVSTRDTALDGVTPYVPVGEVGTCAGSSSGEECRSSTTVLVCDVPADGSSEITPTLVDSNVAAVGQSQFQNHPGPYAALWSGGTFVYPAGVGPAQEHLAATGQLIADLSGCDGASGTLTISVRVRNDGPNPGQAWDGALRLFRGTTALATHNALEWAPSGWQGTLTVSAPVTAADIAAGDIRVALMLETFHLDAKSWAADQFSASLELEGCEATASTQFLRTLVTDCESGDVVSTVDTTLDGDPYTVTGTVAQCTPAPSADDCRDCEQLVLCDVTDTGTNTFLRTVCRDCTGALISSLDTELDGATPYGVAGDVGICATPPAECEAAAVQAFRLCDLNPDVEPNEEGLVCATPFLRHFVYACDGTSTFHDTEMDGVTAYTPVQVVECGENPPSLREQVWNTVSVAQDPANPLVFTYTVANSEDPSQTGTVRMTASKAYGGGCGGTASAPVWNGPVNFVFEPDAAVLAMADVLRVDAIDWDEWEDKTLSPAPSRVESDLGHVLNPGNRWHTLASNNLGHFYFDGPPTSVTMGNRNDGGGLACLAPAFGFITLVAGPPCGGVPELDHIVQPLCDVAPAGTTPFLRHWSVNNTTGLLTALADTTLDGVTGYAVTGTVTVCGQQADAPLLTGVRRLTGSTVVQNLKTEFPGLQSVSLSVIAGTVNVAMSSGNSQPIPTGASVTWSVNDTDDSSLAAASFGGVTTAADYLLVWTYKASASG